MDVRVVAATNRKLTEAIEEGKFRLDLYYRLNVIQILLPPLRERREDIIPLAEHFVRLYNTKFKRKVEGLSHSAAALLLTHDWPGNVRELRNVIERAMVLEEAAWIQVSSLHIESDNKNQAAPLRCADPSPPTRHSRSVWRKPKESGHESARKIRREPDPRGRPARDHSRYATVQNEEV